ncbi:eukaryotic-like serine/threonine-protein kinase [Gammaproteobacteria bacterium]
MPPVRPVKDTLPPPSTRFIGRFLVLKELGKGSQGVVYLAQDSQLQRNVAIKTLRIQPNATERQAMLLQEARAVSRLSHPNIIPIYEVGELDGSPYLVFEFIEGTSLKQYMKQNGPLPIARCLSMMDQILAGIGHAHANKILHGDLSPHNIMVDRAGNPRIMDFGVSRMIGSRQDASLGMWGSLIYMSPEHFDNSPLTEKSDIFALGLILFEMLIQQPVIQETNEFAIINAIANHPIDPPSLRNPDLDKNIDVIVMRALERKSSARYENATAMRKAIEGYFQIEQKKEEEEKENVPINKQGAMDFLLRRMRFKTDFPALSHHIMEINKRAIRPDQTSTADLTNLILKDYGLTSKLLKLVNSPLYRRSSTKITTVSRAVSLLGFEQVRMAALSVVLMEHIKNGQQREELRDGVISGFFNAVLCKDVAERMRFSDPEEAFICAMFHNLGRLLTIYYFPEEYGEIRDLIERKGASEATAYNSVIGLTTKEIGQGISKAWQFPESILQSMDILPEGKIGKPNNDAEMLKIFANFAREFNEATICDDEIRNEKLRYVANRFGTFLSISSKDVDELVTAAVQNVRRFSEAVNMRLEGSQYFKKLQHAAEMITAGLETGENLEEGTQNSEEGENVSSTPTAIQVPSVPILSEEASIERMLQDSIEEISNTLLEEYDLNQILMTILETIYRGFGFSHVLFLVLDKNREAVHVRFGFGSEIEEIRRGMRISLRNKPDIFTLAITKRQDIIIADIDDKAYAGLIPNWFRVLIPARSVVIYPIFVNNNPIGLIYADHNRSGMLDANNPLTLLKTLRNQAVMAIRQKVSH